MDSTIGLDDSIKIGDIPSVSEGKAKRNGCSKAMARINHAGLDDEWSFVALIIPMQRAQKSQHKEDTTSGKRTYIKRWALQALLGKRVACLTKSWSRSSKGQPVFIVHSFKSKMNYLLRFYGYKHPNI